MGLLKAKPSFVDAYREGLDLRAVTVLARAGGRPSKIGFTTDLEKRRKQLAAEGVEIRAEAWMDAGHADLVVAECREQLRAVGTTGEAGWIDADAGTVHRQLLATAAALGARVRSTEEITTAAVLAVERILATIESVNLSGGLRDLNRAYKAYRARQAQSGQGAVGYSAYLSSFATEVIRLAAANTRRASCGRTITERALAPATTAATTFSPALLAAIAGAAGHESSDRFSK